MLLYKKLLLMTFGTTLIPEEKEVYKMEIIILALTQGCTNPRYQLFQVTELCLVVPNIFGSSE